MHCLWNCSIIDRVQKKESAWLIDLEAIDTGANRAKAEDGRVEDWATESLLAARAACQVPGADRAGRYNRKLWMEV